MPVFLKGIWGKVSLGRIAPSASLAGEGVSHARLRQLGLIMNGQASVRSVGIDLKLMARVHFSSSGAIYSSAGMRD
ncbi:MAG: hypothetical protein N3B16_06445 [Candidatus Aminicenantes bacterium]|nr:hypothetical protein [Candidatus Aminicenantes bacterium]